MPNRSKLIALTAPQGGGVPTQKRKKRRSLVDEVATPVVPGFLLDAGVAAVEAYEAACRRGPVVASAESQKLVKDVVSIVVGMRDRARTEAFEIPFAEWAEAKGLTPKAAYRFAEVDGAIPGLVRMGRRRFVRNPNLSAGALLARVHRP